MDDPWLNGWHDKSEFLKFAEPMDAEDVERRIRGGHPDGHPWMLRFLALVGTKMRRHEADFLALPYDGCVDLQRRLLREAYDEAVEAGSPCVKAKPTTGMG